MGLIGPCDAGGTARINRFLNLVHRNSGAIKAPGLDNLPPEGACLAPDIQAALRR
jgi:hypothetical protein